MHSSSVRCDHAASAFVLCECALLSSLTLTRTLILTLTHHSTPLHTSDACTLQLCQGIVLSIHVAFLFFFFIHLPLFFSSSLFPSSSSSLPLLPSASLLSLPPSSFRVKILRELFNPIRELYFLVFPSFFSVARLSSRRDFFVSLFVLSSRPASPLLS